MKKLSRILLLTLSVVLVAKTVPADMMGFHFTDPQNDSSYASPADLSGLTVMFDNSTGDYSAFFQAYNSKPFYGNFSLYACAENTDVSGNANQKFFSSGSRKFDMPYYETFLSITGNDPSFKSWNVGERVISVSLPFYMSPFQPGPEYLSYVSVDPPNSGDFFGDIIEDQGANILNYVELKSSADLPPDSEDIWNALNQANNYVSMGLSILSIIVGVPGPQTSLMFLPDPEHLPYPFNLYKQPMSFIVAEETIYSMSAPPSSNPVPEPTTILLLGTGLAGLAGFGRKSFNRS